MNENMRPMTWKELAHENAEQKKTIEQLKKEKEWLIDKYVRAGSMYTPKENKLRLLKDEMQQALLEESE